VAKKAKRSSTTRGRGSASSDSTAQTKARLLESELYAPIKAFLEGQGYEVKGEVGSADVVAVRGDDDPLVVELKTGFALTLFHQAIDRQAITDAVYVAVPQRSGRASQVALADNMALCRRLGLGLLTVRLRDGFVTPQLDPGPYRPRKSKARKTRLLREFARRVGDPNAGGSTRRGLVTAYRQDALRCLQKLLADGPTKASEVAKATGVETARRIMADDHYGWFERAPERRGIYQVTPTGREAAVAYADELARIDAAGTATS
jgi:hypothetical protein